jgi:ADP-ribosylglycohydrolase
MPFADEGSTQGFSPRLFPNNHSISSTAPPAFRAIFSDLEPGYLADHENLEYYDRMRDLEAFASLTEDSIRSSGYVVDALEAAIWALANSGSFEKTLLKAVNLGDDTDTVGAIAGGLAGLFYGYDAIPADWLAAIQRREWIEGLCERK